MNIRADLNKTAHLLVEDHEWVASPLPGVERVMLDRVGDEVAVATSIVRDAPGSYRLGCWRALANTRGSKNTPW